MNKLKTLKYALAFSLLSTYSFQSCQKPDTLLEVEPRDRFSDGNVWTDKGAADLFLNDIYKNLPSGNTWTETFDNWSDNSVCGFGWVSSRKQEVLQGMYTPNNLSFGEIGGMYNWGNYNIIRKCNIFIKNIETSPLPEEYKKLRVAEVRVLRAYFYHLLWMAYGGVPIITDVLNSAQQGDDIFRARNTFDETLAFITKECAEAYADLPATPASGRMSKGSAMVIKGWCELFANKWADAAASNKKIIDELPYDLHPQYGAFFLTKGNESKESIMYKEYIPGSSATGGNIEGIFGPTFTASGAETSWGAVNPTQELVDDYAMENGKPITDPTSGYNPQDPYKNREKRFYESIVYDGSFWYNDNIFTRQGIGSKNEIDLADKDDATQTGYYLRKRLSDKITLGAPSWDGYTSPQNYSFFRFGEVLLNYAEAQNEAVGPDGSVYAAINRIRKRADIPDLQAGLSKDAMREIIRRERRVELAFEDKRWWDLIRWRIAEVNLNKPMHGIAIKEENGVIKYNKIEVFGLPRKFDASKNYLFPIPQSVIDQNKNLKGHQNPNY